MKPKSILTLCLVILMSTLSFGQKRVTLSSDTTTKSYNFSDYTTLDVASDFEVNVNFSSSDAIKVTANSNLMEYVNIYKEGNTLYLRLKKNMWFKGRMVLDVDVNTPIVTDFVAVADAIINLNSPLQTERASLTLKSDAVFKGKINVDKLFVNATSDAQIELLGSAKDMTGNFRSDSEFDNKDFKVENLTIDLRGDSEVTVTVTRSLNATASGDSELRYAGNPEKVKQSARGDADIVSIR